MTTAKKPAQRPRQAAPKDEVEIDLVSPPEEEEEEEEEAPKADKVTFIASRHATGVKTPSGASFVLSPMMPLKMSRTDAEDLVATGYGSIQGG